MSSLLAMGCLTASAQKEAKTEYVFTPHWYLQAQVGGQYTLGELSFKDLISPNAQLGVGYQFNKVIGARFALNSWQSKAGQTTWKMAAQPVNNGFDAAETQMVNKWKWNYIAPMIDATFNLTNLFCEYNPNRLVTVGVFGGIGANIGFGNDEANESVIAENLEYLWDGSKIRFAARAGANVDFRLSDKVSLGVALQATTLNDHYNSKRAGNADWYFNALAGVKYNLGKTYTTRKVEPVAPVERVIERIVEKPVPAPVTEKVEKPCCEKKAEPRETLRRDIFFTISSNVISSTEAKKVDDIVAYMKKYPEAKVTVTGYADKGTGNNTINDRIAAKRAKIVVDELVRKGISRDRITSASKGSRVQPFADNVKNRVSICIAE